MKKLLLIAIMLFSTTIFAQTAKPIIDSTQVTFNRVYNDVSQALSGLSASLKVGAEHVYSVMLKQQQITVKMYNIIFICLGIGVVLLILLSVFFNYRNSDEVSCFLGIMAAIILIVGIIVVLTCINDYITAMYNPEYNVIKDIRSLISH